MLPVLGERMWVDAETYASEVVGLGDAHAILVEMKQAPATAKPAAKKM